MANEKPRIVTSRLEDLSDDFDSIPSHLKQEGDCWRAISNPGTTRQLSLQLVREIEQQSSFTVLDAKLSPDGQYLAARSDGAAQVWAIHQDWQKIWDVPDSSISRTLSHQGFQPVSFSPDSSIVATGGEQGHILMWALKDGSCRQDIPAHSYGVRTLAFSNGGNLLASGGSDNTVCLWEVDSGALSREFEVHAAVTQVTWSPDGKYLAASSGCDITVWDADKYYVVHRLGGSARPAPHLIASLAFSPCSRKLVSGCFNGLIEIWSMEDGIPIQRVPSMQLQGQNDIIASLAVTPDNRWLLAGSKNRNLMVWDLHTGDDQMLLWGFGNTVTGIDISKTGDMIATSSAAGRIRIWSYIESKL
ncbi:hypothetical protein QQS21_012930 [Conoideocrella luteorostrata]|uniref:WD40 repeat domain-containing protein n=1 Tax=Conoideocrella luteorostrata TaxID=1105319 RepID=A0AAJ0FS13_9HYPO|nr:hypothetical protein QQS21_012930 [Conoideocrella luteorostrata]